MFYWRRGDLIAGVWTLDQAGRTCNISAVWRNIAFVIVPLISTLSDDNDMSHLAIL